MDVIFMLLLMFQQYLYMNYKYKINGLFFLNYFRSCVEPDKYFTAKCLSEPHSRGQQRHTFQPKPCQFWRVAVRHQSYSDNIAYTQYTRRLEKPSYI